DGIRDGHVTGVQTCALPISRSICSATDQRWKRPTSVLWPLLRSNSVKTRWRIGEIASSATDARTPAVSSLQRQRCVRASPRATAAIARRVGKEERSGGWEYP